MGTVHPFHRRRNWPEQCQSTCPMMVTPSSSIAAHSNANPSPSAGSPELLDAPHSTQSRWRWPKPVWYIRTNFFTPLGMPRTVSTTSVETWDNASFEERNVMAGVDTSKTSLLPRLLAAKPMRGTRKETVLLRVYYNTILLYNYTIIL